jgi:hypothetical protein
MQMVKIPKSWRSSFTGQFFEKISKYFLSNAHHQCVYNNCAKFEECQHKGVRGVDYTK